MRLFIYVKPWFNDLKLASTQSKIKNKRLEDENRDLVPLSDTCAIFLIRTLIPLTLYSAIAIYKTQQPHEY
ncbi:MAG: hypothetical protein ACI9WC_001790 [Arenicella sp.]|jgi:hypothetical protein